MNYRLLKIILPGFALLLLVFLVANSKNYAAESAVPGTAQTNAASGTLQKLIVESGSVTMDLDVNGLNGINLSVNAGISSAHSQLHFAAAANSFFSILV